MIPDKAVSIAAEAMEDEAMRLLGRDLGTLHRNDIARAALEAAVPYLTADTETVAAKWELNCKVAQAERDELIRERDRLREEIDRAHHFGTDSGL